MLLVSVSYIVIKTHLQKKEERKDRQKAEREARRKQTHNTLQELNHPSLAFGMAMVDY